MPGESKSGLKIFIFLLIAIIGSIVLGTASFLILSPDSEAFGISYTANLEKKTISKINMNGIEQDIDISFFNKVVIETQNANVKVARGIENAAITNFALDENSFGFYYAGDKTDYSYDLYISENTLYFKLYEPEYSFLKLRTQTKLTFNINASQQQNNLSFEILTQTGEIEIGGETSLTASSIYPLKLNNVNLQTEHGTVILNDSAFVKNNLDIKNDFGVILLKGTINTINLNIISQTGRISAKDLNADNLLIESSKSDIRLDNVFGNVYLDILSGIVYANNIYGDFITSEKIDTARILIERVEGEIKICNDQGRFMLDIKDTNGKIDILSNSGNIKIGNIRKQAIIETQSANVDVGVDLNNKMTIKTKNGNVKAGFKSLCDTHSITTETGKIDVKCAFNCIFYLNANSVNGYINLVWKDEKTTAKEILNLPVGGENPSSANKLSLYSVKGDIIVDRYGG